MIVVDRSATAAWPGLEGGAAATYRECLHSRGGQRVPEVCREGPHGVHASRSIDTMICEEASAVPSSSSVINDSVTRLVLDEVPDVPSADVAPFQARRLRH